MSHSFLEDPGDIGQPGAAGTSSGAEESVPPTGHGQSANGSVRASVGDDGRVTDLWLDPDLFPHGTGNPQALTHRIVEAVNDAIDDHAEKARTSASEVFGGLESELNRVTSGFSESIDRVAGEIEQARKRLES